MEEILVFKMDKNKNIQPMCHEHGRLQVDKTHGLISSAFHHFDIPQLPGKFYTVKFI